MELDLDKFVDAAKEEKKTDCSTRISLDFVPALTKKRAKISTNRKITSASRSSAKFLRVKFGESAIYEQLTLKEDKDVLKAVDLLKDKAKYGTLLKPSKKDKESKG